LATGLDVTDLGTVPTPLLYYALYRLKVDGGIMITGSHNPADYNGFKIALGKTTIHSEQIQEIRKIVEAGDLLAGKGGLNTQALLEDYIEDIRSRFEKLGRPPKVVVDCGNGAASILAPRMFRELGCEVIELYCEMDGRFPNHHPDPTVVENLQDLITEVKKQCADLGVAFDGDGDRIGAVDDQGRIIWGDYLMILYSREVLRRNPGAAIIGEVKCSMNLYNDIESHGGRGIMWKAGHSFIKAKMKEEDAALAGEMSGHMFFADRYFGYDDATYAGCRLLELLSETGQTISELLADVPEVFSTPELRMDIPEKFKFEIVRRAQETFGKKFQTVTVDGVRIVLEDGWALVRASNTQPALVLRFEAETKARLDEIQDGVTRELTAIARSVMSETECLD
jgi:phosphomannomutase/phosphoglucomutase